jgi:hypothetical protein
LTRMKARARSAAIEQSNAAASAGFLGRGYSLGGMMI